MTKRRDEDGTGGKGQDGGRAAWKQDGAEERNNRTVARRNGNMYTVDGGGWDMRQGQTGNGIGGGGRDGEDRV